MRIKHKNFAKVILYFYFALSPLYIFPSGQPQLADLVLIIFLLPWICVSISRLPKITCFTLIPFTYFMIWTAIVNCIYALLLKNIMILKFSLFYGFNLFFLLCFGILLGYLSLIDFFKLMKRFTLVGSLSALSLYIVMGDINVFRNSGTFNNPNQMAYFGLLTFCLSAIIAWADGKWNVVTLVSLISSFILVLLSYSLSAIGATLIAFIGIIILLKIFSKSTKISRNYFIVAILFICCSLSPVVFPLDNAQLDTITEYWKHRFEQSDDKTENIVVERGYNRILNYREYLVIGAGEGEFQRFASGSHSDEIHSSLGTIVFSYGVIGLTFFGLLLISSMRGAPIGIWFIMIAPLSYGINHQGLRQPLFWLCFMIVRLATVKKQREQNLVNRIYRTEKTAATTAKI